jgi:ParB family chromosome partitioning protein
MEELKASIRARGQREPLELYRDARGGLQLKKGWRRLTALRALHAETGDARFAEAVVRIDARGPDREAARIALYVDMVEENAIREDLSFAEMAQLVITARDDSRTGLTSYDEAVMRLYGALHKMKRSYIRQFVTVMHLLGPALPFPRAIPRDLGVELGRALRERHELAGHLAASLPRAATPAAQNALLAAALRTPAPPRERPDRFAAAGFTVTVRPGALALKGGPDFTALPRERLEAALAAFAAALAGQG